MASRTPLKIMFVYLPNIIIIRHALAQFSYPQATDHQDYQLVRKRGGRGNLHVVVAFRCRDQSVPSIGEITFCNWYSQRFRE
jgi:hypothetical protein